MVAALPPCLARRQDQVLLRLVGHLALHLLRGTHDESALLVLIVKRLLRWHECLQLLVVSRLIIEGVAVQAGGDHLLRLQAFGWPSFMMIYKLGLRLSVAAAGLGQGLIFGVDACDIIGGIVLGDGDCGFLRGPFVRRALAEFTVHPHVLHSSLKLSFLLARLKGHEEVLVRKPEWGVICLHTAAVCFCRLAHYL